MHHTLEFPSVDFSEIPPQTICIMFKSKLQLLTNLARIFEKASFRIEKKTLHNNVSPSNHNRVKHLPDGTVWLFLYLGIQKKH